MKTTMKESEKLYRKTIINFIILFVACQIAFLIVLSIVYGIFLKYPFLCRIENDGGVTITKYFAKEKKVDIPEYITGKPVTGIGFKVFLDNKKLTEIILPSTLKWIGGEAFSGCWCIKNIDLPDNLIAIGDEAFRGCSDIKNINLPDNLESIGSRAFKDCRFDYIKIPKSVVRMGSGVFSGSSLKTVELSSLLPEHTFSGCTELQHVIIPDGIERLEEYTFSGCSSLDNVVIPESVIAIDWRCFSNCTNLKKMIIPEKIETIPYACFADCVNLTDLTISDGVLRICGNAFEGFNTFVVVSVLYSHLK
jgi:hypothetical protein